MKMPLGVGASNPMIGLLVAKCFEVGTVVNKMVCPCLSWSTLSFGLGLVGLLYALHLEYLVKLENEPTKLQSISQHFEVGKMINHSLANECSVELQKAM